MPEEQISPRAAVVNLLDNKITAVVMADASKDVAYEGSFLVDVTGVYCKIGWIYDPQTDTFIDPDPQLPQEEESE